MSEKVEATVGFEPTNRGFADPSQGPLSVTPRSQRSVGVSRDERLWVGVANKPVNSGG